MAPKAEAFSSIKPNVNLLEARFNNDVGFATVYRRIYRCKVLTLSNQMLCFIPLCIRITKVVREITK